MGYWSERMIEEELGISSHIVKCNSCFKKYRQDRQDQIPGFRDTEYDICPYCGIINGTSMSVEFFNYKID